MRPLDPSTYFVVLVQLEDIVDRIEHIIHRSF